MDGAPPAANGPLSRPRVSRAFARYDTENVAIIKIIINSILVTYYVYILASRLNGTLYIGVTNDLARRVFEHRQGIGVSFTKQHKVTRLVYAEPYENVEEAIAQEKRLKKWRRAWKVQLIEKENPDWKDLLDS